jgi:hypothetical protein
VGLIKLALNLTDLLSNIIHSHLFLPHKLLHCPLPSWCAFAGLFRHRFGSFLGSSSAGSVVTMIYRSHRDVESLHNGTLESTWALVLGTVKIASR